MTRKTYCGNLLWQSSLTLLVSGYYARDVTCDRIIERMLMNGRGVSGRDLTAGSVFGVRKHADGSYSKGHAQTGFCDK